MKNKEQIALETPLSVTGMDNPIFEIHIGEMAEQGETAVSVRKRNSDEFVLVSDGEKYRLLGCKLVDPTEEEPDPSSPFRLGDGNDVILIPASILIHISGGLGDQYGDIYESI
jgi:hypothetical protein